MNSEQKRDSRHFLDLSFRILDLFYVYFHFPISWFSFFQISRFELDVFIFICVSCEFT